MKEDLKNEVTDGADLAPETEVVRKSLPMNCKNYHPETNKDLKTKKDRNEANQSNGGLPCSLYSLQSWLKLRR